MTANDREYIELTAKVTAQEAVKEFRNTLNCDSNSGRINELEQVVHNGLQDKIEDNKDGIRGMRRYIFWSILGMFVMVVAGEMVHLFT